MHGCVRIVALLFLVMAGSVTPAVSQSGALRGHIVDRSTHQAVEGAFIMLHETRTETASDSTGQFQFAPLPPGRYTFSIRHLGFLTSDRSVQVASDSGTGQTIEIELRPVILQSDEVIIRSARMAASGRSTPYAQDLVAGDNPLLPSSVTIADAITKTPGAYLARDGAWETAVSIRGMSRSNIVMLVDGTRIETANDIAGALSLVDHQDLERVEVLRSPGSTLFGSGALGGVIQLITKRPSFTETPKTDVEITEGVTSVDGGVSNHAAIDNTSAGHAMRISGGYRKARSTMTPGGELPNSQYADFTIDASLGVKTFGTQSLVAVYQRTQAENTGIPGGAPIAAAATAKYLLARRELFSLEYSIPTVSAAIPLITLKASRQEIDRNVEIIQTPVLTLTPQAAHTTLSAQMESKISVMPDAVLTIGIEAWQRGLDSRRERLMKASNTTIEERPVPLSSEFSGGAYVQDEWHLAADRIVIAAGTRYDLLRTTNEDTYNPVYTIASGVVNSQPAGQQLLWRKGTSHNASWSVNAGLNYAATPAVTISCLGAEAYRSPSLEERFQYIDLGNLVRVGSPDLRPENSRSVNIGVTYRAHPLTFQADVFFNRLTDLVTEIPGTYQGRSALIKTNIGEAQIYGYEISGEFETTDWVGLKYSLSYVRGEDRRAHANLPQIAPLNGYAGVSVAMGQVGTGHLLTSFAFTQERTAAGELRTPGYATLDADVSSTPMRMAHASIIVRTGISNIFNAAYRTHLTTLRGLIQLEPGRNFFLSLSAGV